MLLCRIHSIQIENNDFIETRNTRNHVSVSQYHLTLYQRCKDGISIRCKLDKNEVELPWHVRFLESNSSVSLFTTFRALMPMGIFSKNKFFIIDTVTLLQVHSTQFVFSLYRVYLSSLRSPTCHQILSRSINVFVNACHA